LHLSFLFLNRLVISTSPARLLVVLSEQHLFHKRLALELHELHVLLDPSIEDEAHLPWPRKHFGVVDCGFVLEVVGTERGVTLHHMERVAMKISGPVEPR